MSDDEDEKKSTTQLGKQIVIGDADDPMASRVYLNARRVLTSTGVQYARSRKDGRVLDMNTKALGRASDFEEQQQRKDFVDSLGERGKWTIVDTEADYGAFSNNMSRFRDTPFEIDMPLTRDARGSLSGTSAIETDPLTQAYARSMGAAFTQVVGRNDWDVNNPEPVHYAVRPVENSVENVLTAIRGLFHWHDLQGVKAHEDATLGMDVDLFSPMRLNAFFREKSNYNDGELATIEQVQQRFRLTDFCQVVDIGGLPLSQSYDKSFAKTVTMLIGDGVNHDVVNVWGKLGSKPGALLFHKLQWRYRARRRRTTYSKPSATAVFTSSTSFPASFSVPASSSFSASEIYSDTTFSNIKYMKKRKDEETDYWWGWELVPWATFRRQPGHDVAFTDDADLDKYARVQSDALFHALTEFKKTGDLKEAQQLVNLWPMPETQLRRCRLQKETWDDFAYWANEQYLASNGEREAARAAAEATVVEIVEDDSPESKYDAKNAAVEVAVTTSPFPDTKFVDDLREMMLEPHRKEGKLYFHGMTLSSTLLDGIPGPGHMRDIYTLNQSATGSIQSSDVNAVISLLGRMCQLEVALGVGYGGARFLGMTG